MRASGDTVEVLRDQTSALRTFSGVTGVYVSYHLDIASGPAVVLVATAIFLLVFLVAPGRGFLWRRRGR